MKNYYALTFISHDAPGMVSTVSKVLFDNGFNIADSSSTRLQNTFAMIFIVSHEKLFPESELKTFFKSYDSLFQNMACFKCEQEAKPSDFENHYSISIYGSDKPGIVYEITNILANHSINILELQTMKTGSTPSIYIMALEVEIPEKISNEWEEELKSKAKSIGTDITINKIETHEL